MTPDIESAAYWLRAGARYIDTLHERLGIRSKSYADSLRLAAYELDGTIEPEVVERLTP